MKKIISLILCMTMLCGFVTIVNAEKANSLSQNQIALLSAVGVYKESDNLDKILTKGEFAELVSKVAFRINEELENYAAPKTITDVNSHYKYYHEITALYNAGCIPVDSFNRFYPNEEISVNDALELVLRVLGYSDDYFSTYVVNKGLLDNVYDTDGKLSRFSAYIMIANMLECDVSDLRDFKYIGTDSNSLVYMSSKLSLYKVRGIVTDDGRNSLYGSSTIGTDRIRIDDDETFINKTERYDLLGLNITAYVYYDNIEDEYHLLSVFENENKNDITVLNTSNIQRFENRTYYYTETGFESREKHISLPTDVIIIYNGKALGLNDNFTEDMFCPKNGTVKIYSNDSDSKADIVFVDNYETYIAEDYNSMYERIYVKSEKPSINLSTVDYVIGDKDGNVIDPKNIAKNSVLSVAKSIDGTFYKILVSTYTQQATITSYSSVAGEEEEYIITADGGKYVLSAYAKQNKKTPELNMTYKFYFDIFDKVADYEKVVSPDDWQFAYFYKLVYYSEYTDEDYGLTLYTEDGEFNTYKLNKKVKVITESDSTGTSPVIYSPSEFNTFINNNASIGLIRYKVNSDEMITNVELPYTNGRPTVEDRLFRMFDIPTVTGESKKDYYLIKSGQNLNIGAVAYANGDSLIYDIPTDLSLKKEYAISSISVFEGGDNNNIMSAYCTDYKDLHADCVVLRTESNNRQIVNAYANIVTDVRYVYNENEAETMYQIDCVTPQNVQASYYMTDENYKNNVIAFAGDGEAVALSKGDIFWFTASSGYIKKAVVAYDADREVMDEAGNTVIGGVAGAEYSFFDTSSNRKAGNPFASNDRTIIGGKSAGLDTAWRFSSANYRVTVGWVYSFTNNGVIVITTQNPKNGVDINKTKEDGYITESTFFSTGTALAANVGYGGEVEVSKAGAGIIKPYDVYGADCTRVVYVQAGAGIRNMTFYNEQ